MTEPITIGSSSLPSVPLDERWDLSDTVAIYFELAGDA
jgi:hypothetical protein